MKITLNIGEEAALGAILQEYWQDKDVFDKLPEEMQNDIISLIKKVDIDILSKPAL